MDRVVDGVVSDEDEGRESTGLATTLESQTRGEIDIQIATAKRFPRSITQFKREAMEMATLDEETAESCLYALPRGGKTIDGPSARLAEILASAWGHMRIEGRITSEDEKFVTARGMAWDVQRNVAKAVEIRRRITDKNNKRYNDDMIGVTCNAGISIATRNAVLQVVPKAYWQQIYLACRRIVAGDAQTLASRRDAMLKHFLTMGVQNARVFAAIGVQGLEDITLDHLVTLKGVAAAIKNGEVTVDSAFDAATFGDTVPAAPLDDYLANLPADEQKEIRDLLAGAKLNKGQTAVKLKAFQNNPLALIADLKAGAVAKPAEKPVEASKPVVKAKATTKPDEVAPAKAPAKAPAADNVPVQAPSAGDIFGNAADTIF